MSFSTEFVGDRGTETRNTAWLYLVVCLAPTGYSDSANPEVHFIMYFED